MKFIWWTPPSPIVANSLLTRFSGRFITCCCRLPLVVTCCHLVSLVATCCRLLSRVACCRVFFAWCRLLSLGVICCCFFSYCRLWLVNAYHLLLLVACCFCLSLLAILHPLTSHVPFFPVSLISHLLSLFSHLLSLVTPHQSLICLFVRPFVLFSHICSFTCRLSSLVSCLVLHALLQILREAWSEM